MKYSMNLMTANPFSPSPGTTATAQFQKQPLLQTSLTVFGQPLLTILLTGTNDVMTFPILNGELYQLLSTTNIATMNWTPEGPSINGTGASASVTNAIGPQATYYRLQIQN